MAKDPKEIAIGYFERLLNDKDLTVCDEALAANYVDHDAPPDSAAGPGATKAYVSQMPKDIPDLNIEIRDHFSDGEKVALRIEWFGRNRHSGKVFNKKGLVILHFNSAAQIKERWSAYF